MNKSELLQTAKPILFNTEMVRAILDGRKIVTRRVVKPQPIMDDLHRPHHAIPIRDRDGMFHFEYLTVENIGCDAYPVVPRYNIGNILYVRETWCKWINGKYYFKADPTPTDKGVREDVKWHPSIHMPKEAARIFLRVTDVRVERLQDITEEQVVKEGLSPYDDRCVDENWKPTFHDPDSGGTPRLREGFKILWDSTIKKADLDKYDWNANPWVWAYEFEKVNVE